MHRKPLLIAMGLCLSVGLYGCSDSGSGNGDSDNGATNDSNGNGNGNGNDSIALEEGSAPWLMYTMDLTSQTTTNWPDLESGLWAASAETPEARDAVDPDADLEGPFISLHTETVNAGIASDASVDRVIYLQTNGNWATVNTQADGENLEPRRVSDVESVDLEQGDDFVAQWDKQDADNAYVAWRNNESDPYRAVSLDMDENASAHELEVGLEAGESIRELLTGLQDTAGEPDGWLAFTDNDRLIRIGLNGSPVTELQGDLVSVELLGEATESGSVLLLTNSDEDLADFQPHKPKIYQPGNNDLVDVTLDGDTEQLRLLTPEFTFEDGGEEFTTGIPVPVAGAAADGDSWHFLVTYPIDMLDDEQISDAQLRQFTVSGSGETTVQDSELYLSNIDPVLYWLNLGVEPAPDGIVNLEDRLVYRAEITEEKPANIDLEGGDLDQDYLDEFRAQDNRSIENCAVTFARDDASTIEPSALIEEDGTTGCVTVSSLGEFTAAGEAGAVFWEKFELGGDTSNPVATINASTGESLSYGAQWLGGGIASEEGNAGLNPDNRTVDYVLLSGREDSQELRLIDASQPESDVSSARLLGAMQDIDAEGLSGSNDNRASLRGNTSGPYRLVLLESDVSGAGGTSRHIAWINTEEPDSLTPLNPITTQSVGDTEINERPAQNPLTRPLDGF